MWPWKTPAPPPFAPSAESEVVRRARDRLREAHDDPAAPGRWPLHPVLADALALDADGYTRYARQLVGLLRRAYGGQVASGAAARRFDVCLAALHALFTYQDPDLPADARLDRALAIVMELRPDARGEGDVELFDVLGGIHKRKWMLDGHSEHLEDALAWYNRALEAQKKTTGIPADLGYAWINCAFVLDLLAARDERLDLEAAGSARGRKRRLARAVRADLVRRLTCGQEGTPAAVERFSPESRWAYHANLGEALLALGECGRACAHLLAARRVYQAHPHRIPRWQLEFTARHLAVVMRRADPAGVSLEQVRASESWRAVAEFLGDDVDGLPTIFVGKVGLALSGGGFRASFFHLGMLAYLAEVDLLRHVEVLSCVSGGSIIGALYALELARHYRTKGEPSSQDYVDIVERMHTEFLRRVGHNIRARALVGLSTNLRLLFQPYYTRTRRVGELLEEWIYAEEGGKARRPLVVGDLMIDPEGTGRFNPKTDNWGRAHKVPMLLLNATTLNTGHNWQFAVTWMGEPPSETDIDANARLRRLYYHEAHSPMHQRVRLGEAVVASACVPGIFEPVALPRLYQVPPGSEGGRPDRSLTARLVDGGVHDNQGISSLLQQNCSVVLVSDASGQMSMEERPSTDPLGVLQRTNQILMARVRAAQYMELRARTRSGLIHALMFLHLKKQLNARALNWVGCAEPPEGDDALDAAGGGRTRYGVLCEVQEKLANIRTDLDSFSETEACALMLSGYRMARYELERDDIRRALHGFETPELRRPAWRFLELEPLMTGEVDRASDKYRRFLQALELGSHRMFKVWMAPSAGAVATAAGMLLAALGAAAGVLRAGTAGAPSSLRATLAAWPFGMPGSRVAEVLGLAVVALLVVFLYRSLIGERMGQAATGIVSGMVGLVVSPFVFLHLHVFHRFYLRSFTIGHTLGYRRASRLVQGALGWYQKRSG